MKKAALLLLAAIIMISCGKKVEQGEFTLKMKDGAEVSYLVKGTKGQPLVIVHGWCIDKTYFNNQVEAFSKDHIVIAVDMAGHGKSGLQRENYTVELFGSDIAEIVNHLGLKDVILIGHSMGGNVIMEAASKLPGKVKGLIGVDTYQNFEFEFPQEQFEGWITKMKEDFKGITYGWVKTMFPETSDSVLVEEIANDMASAPPKVGITAMISNYNYKPIPVISKLGLPVMAVNTDLWPADVEINKKHCDFNLLMMKGYSHYLMRENPEKFNELLAQAIKEINERK